MVAVVALVSAVIVILPVTLLWLSFRDAHPVEALSTYSFQHYFKGYGDSFLWEVLGNTLGFSFITLAVALFFGLIAAWLAVRTDLPGKSVLYTSMTLGVLMPGFASAMGWLFLLHPRIGLLNQYLMDTFGFSDAPLNIASVPGMGFVQGLSLAPVAFVMTAAVLRAIDPSLEESAQILGASWMQTMREITLPLIRPGLFAGWLLVFVPVIQELSASILLFSSKSITLAVAIYNLYETGYIEPVAALAMINMLIIGAAIFVANKLGGGRIASRSGAQGIAS